MCSSWFELKIIV